MNNFTIGQYFPGNSPVHRMDPRAKIGLTVALIAAIFLAQGFVAYAVYLLFIVLCAKAAEVDLKFIVRGIKPILFIVLFTFVLNVLFQKEGTVLWRWAFITITREGLRKAVFMAFRLVLLVMASQLLTLTTSPIALTDGLESIMKPLSRVGFPAHELAMIMAIALRFIPTLMEETDKIMKAQKARGADFESGNIIQRARAMIPLLVPLFVSAFRRADELAMAMEARCYRGGAGRTRMKRLKFTRLDLYGTAAIVALYGCVIALNVVGAV